MTSTTLYRFFDAEGQLLYVGMTGIATVRWFTHARQKSWWSEVATISVEHYADRAEAHRAELQAIRTERPRYNVAGLHAPPRPLRVGGTREYGTGSVFWNTQMQRWVATLPNSMGRATKTFRSREHAEAYLTAVLGLSA